MKKIKMCPECDGHGNWYEDTFDPMTGHDQYYAECDHCDGTGNTDNLPFQYYKYKERVVVIGGNVYRCEMQFAICNLQDVKI